MSYMFKSIFFILGLCRWQHRFGQFLWRIRKWWRCWICWDRWYRRTWRRRWRSGLRSGPWRWWFCRCSRTFWGGKCQRLCACRWWCLSFWFRGFVVCQLPLVANILIIIIIICYILISNLINPYVMSLMALNKSL